MSAAIFPGISGARTRPFGIAKRGRAKINVQDTRSTVLKQMALANDQHMSIVPICGEMICLVLFCDASLHAAVVIYEK